MLYKCVLVKGDLVKELFYREGESAEQIKKELESFQWPKGRWLIVPTNECGEDE